MPEDLFRPPDFSLEAAARCRYAASTRSGRGPWAGPVVAAAVILDPGAIPEGLDDSKRLTPPGARRCTPSSGASRWSASARPASRISRR